MQSNESPKSIDSTVVKKFKEDYNSVFQEIQHEIKSKKRGVLFTVIHIICGEEKSKSQYCCQYYQIDDKSNLNDDYSISKDIIKGLYPNPSSKIKSNNMWTKILSLINELFTSNFISYFDSYTNFIAKCRKKEQNKEQFDKVYEIPPSKSKTLQLAALCLVVQASVVKNIKKGDSINVSQIEEFIDSTLYFLCTTPERANEIQQLLEFTEEENSNVSEQTEVYVRIDFYDGEEVIGKKVPYMIKRNLSENDNFVVEELACLKYLSNLENFNRV